jgi:hypothetical protein
MSCLSNGPASLFAIMIKPSVYVRLKLMEKRHHERRQYLFRLYV